MERWPELAFSPPGKRKYGDAKGKVPQPRDVTMGKTRGTSIAFCPVPNHGRYTDGFEVNMPIQATRFHALQLACFVLCVWMLVAAQATPNRQSPAPPSADYSGMYSFLRDGEFVQVTVEDHGRVTGFVSRYGDSESDRGVFLDHFFKSGKLEGDQLAFTTEAVHGVSFEFRGTVERGEGKKPGDEAYYVLKGTLVENTSDEAKKTSSRSRDVALKGFPQDLAPPQTQKK
jgi:hypothetical protein